MTTTLVNIARGDTFDVYVGRPGLFGNPSRVGSMCVVCYGWHTEKGETIECYRKHFAVRVATDAVFRDAVLALRGKRLGCYCAGTGPCHGDVIVEYLDGGNADTALDNLFNRMTS